MSKRRTRREKETAHHQFTLSWEGEAEKVQSEPRVKRQFQNSLEPKTPRFASTKNANILAKDASLEPIKADIVKSLILASLILGVELVIYLAWFRNLS